MKQKPVKKPPAAPMPQRAKKRTIAKDASTLSLRERAIVMSRERSADQLGEEVQERICALWYGTRFADGGEDARRQLLTIAIAACRWINSGLIGSFESLAPFAEGWPVILADGRELTRDVKAARLLVRKLRAGSNHAARRELTLSGEFASFVHGWLAIALVGRGGKVTAADVHELPKLAEKTLTDYCGKAWQDDPSFTEQFGGRSIKTREGVKLWEKAKANEKRDFVRDKFEGAARTFARQLGKFGTD